MTEPAWKDELEPGIKKLGSTNGRCPECDGPLIIGFGLAGGGYGAYEYCAAEDCQRVVTKMMESDA